MPMLKINLLPPRIKAARQKRMLTLAAIGVGAALLTIPVGILYARMAQAAALRSQIKALDKETSEYAGIIEKVTALEAQEALLAKKLETLDKLTAKQSVWIRVLESLSFSQARSRDLWFTSVTSRAMNEAGDQGKTEIVMTGFAFSIASVEDFISSFQKTEFKPELNKQTMTSSVAPGQPVIAFSVSFKFKV